MEHRPPRIINAGDQIAGMSRTIRRLERSDPSPERNAALRIERDRRDDLRRKAYPRHHPKIG